jgi:4-diphosphocytidyl-2-C-methyl-D-erythritol kinase
MPPALRIPAFAKVNLTLRIVGRRPDGYHELRTIFQTISLHDTIELSPSERPGVRVACPGTDLNGRANLVWHALDRLRRALGLRAGVDAIVYKRIPMQRGLGGGSSDAAAALIGLLRLTRKIIEPAKLLEIAAGLGADVPFFLFGGRALGVSRGDEVYPLPDMSTRTILVVSPRDIAVPTKDAFAWASAALTKSMPGSKLYSFCALCWSPQEDALVNDFEPAVFRRQPRLARIKRELLRRGAAEAALAGSGSAVFAVFPNPAQARRAARAFPQDSVYVTDTLSRRRYLRRMGWPGILE